MSVFLICAASSSVLPFSHSVARLELAIALPHPNVLNLASSIALGRADDAGSHRGILLIQAPDVPGIVVVIDYLFAVRHCLTPPTLIL
jgi:hypothetical protein